MNKPAGWYILSVNDDMARYWDGQRFTGDNAPRLSQEFPLFVEEQQSRSPYYNPYAAPVTAPPNQPIAAKAKPSVGKAIVGAIVLLFILIIMVSCTASVISGGSSTSSSSSNGEVSMEQKNEVFVTVIRQENPDYYAQDSDEQIIALGAKVCSTLDSGVSITEMAVGFVTSDVDAGAAGTLMGASITTYCPEYQDEMDAFVETTK